MKILTIGGRDYTFEFSIEASLYNECTEKITSLMVGVGQAREGESGDSSEKIKNVISTISNVPVVAMTMFYAGLLEHHGPSGDGAVKGMKDAKTLVRQYLTEHKDDDKGNFYSVMDEMIECMEDDGFFELTGMTRMLKNGDEEVAKKAHKVPQDHKKKSVGVTKN